MGWSTTDEKFGLKRDSNEMLTLLNTTSNFYIKQTEWFLKQKEKTLIQLSVVIFVELIFLIFPQIFDGLPKHVNILFLLLSIFSIIMTITGLRNCEQSYRSAIENMLLYNKLSWSLAPSGKIFLEPEVSLYHMPASDDNYLFISRYFKNLSEIKDTEHFVDNQLSIKNGIKNELIRTLSLGKQSAANNYFWTFILIWALCYISIFTSMLCYLAAS